MREDLRLLLVRLPSVVCGGKDVQLNAYTHKPTRGYHVKLASIGGMEA